MNLREAVEASTILCGKKDREIPLSGDFSMLRTWPLQPVELFQDKRTFQVYDLHYVHVSVMKSKADILVVNMKQLFPDPNTGMTVVELGGLMGGLDVAFRASALGDYLGEWNLKIPEDFGAGGELGNSLALQFLRVERKI
ncbi:MAG TPA: hypothetical protein ENI27_00785 [bacterium]|nr:hypothetical protein [bacterium]